MRANQTSSGKIYVQHVLVGIFLIFAAVLFFKTSKFSQSNISFFVAISILLVNAFAVISFLNKVISSTELLNEEDSADHAYYLGFSLTLAALAITFFFDASPHKAINHQDLAAKGDLVRGALTQFAAGLTATLFGLSARIYISSKQNKNQKNPDDLVRELRSEIDTFSRELSNSRAEHTRIVSETTNMMLSSIKKFDLQAKKLSDTFESATTIISESLSPDKIDNGITAFLNSLNTLSRLTNESSNTFISSIDQAASTAGVFSNNLQGIVSRIDNINSSLVLFSSQIKSISEVDLLKLPNNIETFTNNLHKSEAVFSESIGLTRQKIDSLIEAVEITKSTLVKLGQELPSSDFNQLKQDVNKLSDSVQKLSEQMERYLESLKLSSASAPNSRSFFGR